MHLETQNNSRVDNIINSRRDESDARDIIKEVERLGLFEGQHRFRWIWELVQNARDEAGEGVEIVCTQAADVFTFEHNGKPFKSDHLVALTLRSSTKPLDNSGGSAGKFGTGFVTTHLLNKCVKISGVHLNEEGIRRFEHYLDRRPTDIEPMMRNLGDSIQSIRKIDALPPETPTDLWNRFEYGLSEGGKEIAAGGIRQLEINLAFSLLINSEKIKSVRVQEDGVSRTLSIKDHKDVFGLVSFVKLLDDTKPEGAFGLLYKVYGDLIVAMPANFINNRYYLTAAGESARLFKELPLIGSEDFAIPNIIQHEKFKPTEPRDGVRTKMVLRENEDDVDPVGDANRSAFKDYVNAFPNFLDELIVGEVQNLHLMAETSFPLNPEKIYSSKWLSEELQDKLRAVLLTHRLVKTMQGDSILIGEAIFPASPSQHEESLHELISELYPTKTPDTESFRDWSRILSHEPENWPDGIRIGIDALVEKITGVEMLSDQLKDFNAIVPWLQKLVSYLEETQNESLGRDFAIYPNQAGGLQKEIDIFHETKLENQFKLISEGLGRDLSEELLPKSFKAKYVQEFDIKEFLSDMNNTIGMLNVEAATETQTQAIIQICCTFKRSRAEKREAWFDLLHRLMPEKAKEKVYIDLEEEYSWDTAEKWTLKWVSLLIQRSCKLEKFVEDYFKEESDAIDWLNDFLKFVHRNEETKTALENNIIPTQDGVFRKYEDNIYREDKHETFLPLLKSLYKKQVGFSDPASFLIHKDILNSNLRSNDVSILTRPLDDIFKDVSVEEKVKEGHEYHDLFMTLKELIEHEFWAKMFPLFSEKQPVLFIKAFGAGSSIGRLMKIRKPIEEMEKLAALSLTADQLKQLDDAAKTIGNVQQLIDKANQMAETAEEIRWRQDVGDAAEKAFLEAISEAHPHFAQPENPDNGRDFIIRIGADEYSIEIKSAIIGKESVKMSLKQGEEAERDCKHYALCVINRPFGTFTTKEQFINNARFVTDIGYQIGDKVRKWREGLSKIETNENVSVALDNKNGYVNIRKTTWEDGSIDFSAFIELLKVYFNLSS
ncbi:sacsin N-terminal ATP-binding-like domain-containing protein [Pedobacter nanyangensis]|uniref:sacsin N-terminal ATP-binding-like domain-containing protein n=1 Tax=Pedobacter nanyangensis TaxID=1562389 RepID=UPI000DE40B97|nr:hypothetical protein [Pedobacter nanyangensis]